MSRLLPVAVDRRPIDDERIDDGTSSSDGGGVYIPVIEGSVSGDGDDDSDGDSAVSDCESVVTGSGFVEREAVEVNGVVRLEESDRLRGVIERKFVARLSEVGVEVGVECVRRNLFSGSVMSQARVGSFQIYMKAVEKRNGGDANVKYAWFGGAKEEIDRIVLYGFGGGDVGRSGFCEHAVVLSADHSPLESVESAIADEDGTKHILLCRVLLGKTELVNPGSTQSHPSSGDFQSGVDDLVSPKKYIVWSSQMNTHILPEFVISFKILRNMYSKSFQESIQSHHISMWFQLIIHTIEYYPGPKVDGVRPQKPVSPWIPIPDLIAALSKILPPKAINELTQFRRSYIERKISRHDMIRGIRRITGDRILLKVLKNFTEQRRSNRFG